MSSTGRGDRLHISAEALAAARAAGDRQPQVTAPDARAELVLTSASSAGRLAAETARTSTSFTIFEGTSEIQRMIIGRAVTGLDVR